MVVIFNTLVTHNTKTHCINNVSLSLFRYLTNTLEYPLNKKSFEICLRLPKVAENTNMRARTSGLTCLESEVDTFFWGGAGG